MALAPVSFILLFTVYVTANVSGQCTLAKKYGPDCRYDCNCASGETCDGNTRCTTCANGWDGPTCHRQNVALGRQTIQSSTYVHPRNGNRYPSSAAVDGLLGNGLDLPCTHTVNNTPAIWEVTLNQTYTISRFRIYNRGDAVGNRLNGFVVSVWPSSGPSSNCYTDHTTVLSGPGNIIYNECQDGATGNLVRIQIPSGYLSLCEVLLYVCSDGTYGEECEHYCGKCRDSYVCNPKSGDCPDTGGDRCKSGFTGDKCKACVRGSYGLDCAESCGYCADGPISCNHVTGACPQKQGQPLCTKGYTGEICKTACLRGSYGLNCAESCGYCADGPNSCNHITGACPQKQGQPLCIKGYTGENCKTESKTDTGLIVGCVAGVVVLVLIVVIVGLLYKRRSRQHHENETPSDVREARPTRAPQQQEDIVMRTISGEVDTPNTEGKGEDPYEIISDNEYEKVSRREHELNLGVKIGP